MSSSLDDAHSAVRAFNALRPSWRDVHSPKNLAMAVASEAGEILSILRWQDGSSQLDAEMATTLEGELADVAIFLFALADACGVDLPAAIATKLQLNAARYPPA